MLLLAAAMTIALAATDRAGALFPMLAYTAGLGIPFLAIGALGTEAIGLLGRFRGFVRYFNILTGLFLLAVGILMLTGRLAEVSNFLFPIQITGAA